MLWIFFSEKLFLLRVPPQAELSAVQCERRAHSSVIFRGIWAAAGFERESIKKGCNRNPKAHKTASTVFVVFFFISPCFTILDTEYPLWLFLDWILFWLLWYCPQLQKYVAPLVEAYFVPVQFSLPPCCSWAQRDTFLTLTVLIMSPDQSF